jgi:hypothetical protein
MSDTFGVHLQCHKNKAATEFCVGEFRKFYKDAPFRIVSDNGSDYTVLKEKYGVHYDFESEGSMKNGHFNDFEGISLFLERLKDTCVKFDTDWIIVFEDDVLTKKRISQFPETSAAGLCAHKFRDPLDRYIRDVNPTATTVGYGMCGGSIFRRKDFLLCFEKIKSWYDRPSGWTGNGLLFLETMDKRIVHYSDIVLTALFMVNGYDYSLWSELEQGGSRGGNAALEHNFKKYY